MDDQSVTRHISIKLLRQFINSELLDDSDFICIDDNDNIIIFDENKDYKGIIDMFEKKLIVDGD